MAIKRDSHSGAAIKLLLGLIAAGIANIIPSIAIAATPTIVTSHGQLTGTQTATTNEYLGIPYAIPPVGPLRWTPPQLYGMWPGVLQATQFGNYCMQPGLGSSFASENCLFLNVYTAISATPGQNLPVMVWIHGGGLVTGGGGIYDPTRIIDQGGVIVVTINYRLGYLGFFAHPAIDAEGHLKGNYGLMDQQLALQWVRDNIAAFGGDPSRVTIFGESAGGQSVYANLASPTAAGLFRRAIAESGAYSQFQDYYRFIVPMLRAETIGTSLVPAGKTIAKTVGCTRQTAACLRGVPASALIAAIPATQVIYPFVDGKILTRTPSAAFALGKFNRVPVISGGNHDEYRLFVAEEYDLMGHPLVTLADYQKATKAVFGNILGPVVYTSEYPLAHFPNPGEALGASTTDSIFACPERNSVRLLSKYVPTYAYEFNDENAYLVVDFFPPSPPITFPLGAAHGFEIPYLFDILSFPGTFTTGQEQLSEAMISYWTQFAATGDPNSVAEPAWTPYKSVTPTFQSLVPPAPIVETTFDTDHLCSAFWNKF
jgi:para-nitrobenzyl esterase